MITKEQAIALGDGTIREDIHMAGCCRHVGPRGGTKELIVRVRVNGRCQTWKTRPDEFRLPVVYGLRGYGDITHRDAEGYHLASECPLGDVHD